MGNKHSSTQSLQTSNTDNPRTYACVRKPRLGRASVPDTTIIPCVHTDDSSLLDSTTGPVLYSKESCVMGSPNEIFYEGIGIPGDSANPQYRVKYQDPYWKWPNSEIHYEIDLSLDDYPNLQSEITTAIQRYHEITPIKFIKLGKLEPRSNWVVFMYHPELTDSELGRQGGIQSINISHWARKGNIMHEIMHVLGFHHEHSREDRDHYVTINRDKISDNLLQNYEKEGYPLGDYDPESIMHYGTDEYMESTRLLSRIMGQRVDFSQGDLKAIRYVYSNPSCTYDFFKDEYFVQTNFECLTCWGAGSVYGVCVYCASKCHPGHELVIHHYAELAKDNIKFVCDCGRNGHKMDICTRISTEERYVQQKFYICYECFDVDQYKQSNGGRTPGVCHPCLNKCHSGHVYEELGVQEAFCDCGKSYCKIKCKGNKMHKNSLS